MFMAFYSARYTTESTLTTYVTVPRRNSPFTLTVQKTGSFYSPPTLTNKICVFPRQVIYIYIYCNSHNKRRFFLRLHQRVDLCIVDCIYSLQNMNWNFMFYLNSSKSLSTRKGFPWYPSVLEHGISKYHSENSALLVGPTKNNYQYSFPIKKEIKFFPLTLNQKS